MLILRWDKMKARSKEKLFAISGMVILIVGIILTNTLFIG
ncbi:MAG: hypothetical protein ACJAX4_004192 [Clostridium sp.]|jgi:hypothetical protein